MRWMSFSVIVALAFLPEEASAAWAEYMYSDLGIAKEFPAAPNVESGIYETSVAGGGAPLHQLSYHSKPEKHQH